MGDIKVDTSEISKGLGIFALKNFKKGEVIEKCPLLLVPRKEFGYLKKTKLYYYYFDYNKESVAIALGYGSLYNHSYAPNARYLYDYKYKNLKIVAIKNIKASDEIFFNYNYYPNNKTPLPDWFKENTVATK